MAVDRQEQRESAPAAEDRRNQLSNEVPQRDTRSFRSRAIRRLKRSLSAKIGVSLVSIMVLMAITAAIISPHDPYEFHPQYQLMSPNEYFPFGTDQYWRDVMSRLIHGSHI
jgi:peptide/nickel transport system permease protein